MNILFHNFYICFSGTLYSPELLISMMLQKAKEDAETFAGTVLTFSVLECFRISSYVHCIDRTRTVLNKVLYLQCPHCECDIAWRGSSLIVEQMVFEIIID